MRLFKARCYHGGKLHNFVARYDEQPRVSGSINVEGCSPAELRKLIVIQVYVHDVCTWCGTVVKR